MVLYVRRQLVFFCTCLILPLEIIGWPGPLPSYYQKFGVSKLTGVNFNVLSEDAAYPVAQALVSTDRGPAIRLDHTLKQWIDLGDQTEPCLTRPDTCNSDGGALSLWARVRCSTYSGILSSQRKDNARGIHIGCTPHGITTSINIAGGYYVKLDDNKPLVEWSHIVVNYYVDLFGRTNLNAFTTYVNGAVVFTDRTKYKQKTTPGYGKLVIGRAFTNVDDLYTSMEVDHVVFFNENLSNDNIDWLLRNNI